MPEKNEMPYDGALKETLEEHFRQRPEKEVIYI